jgi:hypothetical protein
VLAALQIINDGISNNSVDNPPCQPHLPETQERKGKGTLKL